MEEEGVGMSGDNGLNSHQNLGGADDEETIERLLDIRDALQSLESQLLALQNLQHQQSYEKEVALAEIDYSRRVVLEKLEEYKGKVSSDPTNEAKNLKQHDKQDKSKNSRKGFGHFISSAVKTVLPLVGVMYILSLSNFVPNIGKRNLVKTFGMSLQRATEEKNSNDPCPPGKVLVMEDGEARCLVKERIEVPFESIVAKPDVNYGCG
ncbi:PLASTID DIVISION2 [Hibiscus trionum]|uniref:PLASTID DIVISION2 n=1 Tax=Hibiscus trionum TaxID=183268 RepID=A0A9W7H3Z6_HIBTR|nr:PLASTID DIVISION2 [Hibiscus trionum]